jgi:hypothetical protein
VRNLVTTRRYHELLLCNTSLCRNISGISFLIRRTKAWNRKMICKLRRRDLRFSKRAREDSSHVGYDLLKIFPLFTWILKIKAARSTEMSLTIYQSTCLRITEDINLQSYRIYPFQKRNYMQLKCVTYICLLESLCFSQDCLACSSSETQNLSISETNTLSHDLCDRSMDFQYILN